MLIYEYYANVANRNDLYYLALALFVFNIFASDINPAFASDGFTIAANNFYGCSYFHMVAY
jgi:hypothetical protein